MHKQPKFQVYKRQLARPPSGRVKRNLTFAHDMSPIPRSCSTTPGSLPSSQRASTRANACVEGRRFHTTSMAFYMFPSRSPPPNKNQRNIKLAHAFFKQYPPNKTYTKKKRQKKNINTPPPSPNVSPANVSPIPLRCPGSLGIGEGDAKGHLSLGDPVCHDRCRAARARVRCG